MSRMQEHEELRAVISAGAPATLSSQQIDRMLRHAEECPACAAELREIAARAIAAQAPAVRLDSPHRERLRARVLARAAPVPAPVRDGTRRASTRPPVRRSDSTGWMAAAVLAVALLTHHGFHQPLSSGWLAAAGFALLALGLGSYALAQRRRVAELRDQLNPRDPGPSHHVPEP